MRPEGALKILIPEITLVEWYASLEEQSSVFILECLRLVMGVLVQDVFPDDLEMRRTYAEESVACLPSKLGQIRAQPFCKLGRVLLEYLNYGHGCGLFREVAKDVDVVRVAADRDGFAL